MNYKLNTGLIKLKMLEKGYSITRLAIESQIAKSTIARAVNGQGTQRSHTIYQMAKTLEIEMKDMII